MLLIVVQDVCLVLILLFVLRTLILHLLTWTYFARYDQTFPLRNYTPTVSMIKPVKGLDPGMLENFRTFCRQDYSQPYEIIFAVEDPTDPCIPLIRQLIQEYPRQDIRLILSDPREPGANRKVTNLVAGCAASRHDVIMTSDSDVYLTPDFLRAAVAPLQAREIGLVFAPPVVRGIEDWIAAMFSIAISATVLGLAPLSLLKRQRYAVGWINVLRRDALDAIGGLGAVSDYYSDDVMLARQMLKAGYRVHMLKQPASIQHRRDALPRWWQHMLRWLVASRGFTRFSYIFAITESVLYWAVLYFILSAFVAGTTGIGISLLVTVCGVRLLSTAILNWRLVRDPNLWAFLWAAVVYDALKLPLLVHSYFTRELLWRGHRLRLNRDGTITLLDARAG